MPCQALTKAGTPCKLPALPDSDYCAVHHRQVDAKLAPSVESQAEASPTRAASSPPALSDAPVSAPTPQQPPAPARGIEPNLDLLVRELEALAQELQHRLDSATSLTPAQMLGLVNKSVGRFAPELPRETLRDLERNLEGSTFRDLIDPETLKGLFYLLTYSLQGSSAAMREQMVARLARLPGYSALAELAGNLEGTTPRDLVDPETWKGFWYIANYTAQQQLADARRRILGESQPPQE
jgi:hypothetical protein